MTVTAEPDVNTVEQDVNLAEQDIPTITAQQGPVGGKGGNPHSVNIHQNRLKKITTWAMKEDARLRGIELVLAGKEEDIQITLGEPSGDMKDEATFKGNEMFTRLEVAPTTVKSGRVAGFILYWSNDRRQRISKRFGLPDKGDLARAQFNQPAGNVLRDFVIRVGSEIDAMGVVWVFPPSN